MPSVKIPGVKVAGGATLWEIIRHKTSAPEEPAEFKVYNPLRARTGDFLSIDTDELSGKHLTISQVRVYTRTIGSDKFNFTDYVASEGDAAVVVRVNTISNPDPFSHKKCNVLLLGLDFESSYSENNMEDFHKSVLPTGIMEVRDDKGEVIATYERVNGVADPYEARVTVFDDRSGQPKTESLDYWDFGRDNNGKPEFYLVEMDTTTGYMKMLKGSEISEKDVLLLPAGLAEV